MPKQINDYYLVLAAGMVFCCLAVTGWAQADLTVVEGSVVSIEYRVELTDSTAVFDNVGKDPMVYEAGGAAILPALDAALRGLKAGDAKVVYLKPEDAYGAVNGSLFVEVPLEQLPEDARHAGAVLVSANDRGEQQRVTVREVKDAVAIVDYNHPLAGQNLVYRIKILDVK
ncbi:FKBP-type peptidyl-prolyl cis-trans isomerase [Gammaproteobacteria bacterium]|nr:FKBP-type peptidyl-prolyl cis-trans isomerase [Gammaproteobacteria bacterium]